MFFYKQYNLRKSIIHKCFVGNIIIYLNFEMALKIDAEKLQKFLFKDPVYQQFKNEERFIKILERYSIVFPD